MRASFTRYLSGIKRAVFTSSKGGRFFTPFNIAATGYLSFQALEGTRDVLKKRGNIDLYRGLYVHPGENIMASGKRGIDANIGGTQGLVQGLHSNRRRY